MQDSETMKPPRSVGERLLELRSVAILILLWAALNLAITVSHREEYAILTHHTTGDGRSFEHTYRLPLELSDFGMRV